MFFKKYNVKPAKIIMTGDFNDYTGALLNKTINVLGYNLRIPNNNRLLTCCTDNGYQYPGDYIFIGEDVKILYYGYPKDYIRENPLISDHDPVAMII